MCRKEGHEDTTRTTGKGAIEALEKNRFDVILSDLRMEKVDGMAILRRVKELDPETAVVLITGYATLDSAVEAMKAGAFHYIAKPFRLNEVREVVRNALELVPGELLFKRLLAADITRDKVPSSRIYPNQHGKCWSQGWFLPAYLGLVKNARDVDCNNA